MPSSIFQKENLTDDEWEVFRLHPYYTDRVLSRVGHLSSLALEASAHHESVNGQGYHRQLSGDQIRIVLEGFCREDTGNDLCRSPTEEKSYPFPLLVKVGKGFFLFSARLKRRQELHSKS